MYTIRNTINRSDLQETLKSSIFDRDILLLRRVIPIAYEINDYCIEVQDRTIREADHHLPVVVERLDGGIANVLQGDQYIYPLQIITGKAKKPSGTFKAVIYPYMDIVDQEKDPKFVFDSTRPPSAYFYIEDAEHNKSFIGASIHQDPETVYASVMQWKKIPLNNIGSGFRPPIPIEGSTLWTIQGL